MKQRKLVIDFIINMENYNRGLKHADSTLKSFAHQATGSTTGAGKSGIFGNISKNFSEMFVNRASANPLGGLVGGLMRGASAAIPVLAGVAVAGGLMWGALSAGKESEIALTRLKTVTGNAAEARNIYKNMLDFASHTPMEMTQIMPAATQLLAVGMSADNLRDKLRMIGDVSSGSGKNFNELTSIMAKNFSTGLVQTEDLNQLTDARIPILKVLGEMYNKNGQQIRDMASKGQIHYSDLEKAFDKMTSKGGIFFGAMESQSKTVDGLLSTLRDSINQAFVAMSGVMEPEGKTTMWTYIGEIMGKIGKGFGDLVTNMSPFLTDLGTVFGGVLKLIYNIWNVASTMLTPIFYYVGFIVWGIVKALNAVLWVSNQIFRIMANIGNATIGWVDRVFHVSDTMKLIINQLRASWDLTMIYIDIMLQKFENFFAKSNNRVLRAFGKMIFDYKDESGKDILPEQAKPLTAAEIQQQQIREARRIESLRKRVSLGDYSKEQFESQFGKGSLEQTTQQIMNNQKSQNIDNRQSNTTIVNVNKQTDNQVDNFAADSSGRPVGQLNYSGVYAK